MAALARRCAVAGLANAGGIVYPRPNARDPDMQDLSAEARLRSRPANRGFVPRHRRRILCVFPRYAPSFGTFQHAYRLFPGVSAFMPPQGLLVIAAYLPQGWEVRFVDENRAPARDADFDWADAVFISGMHVQRPFIDDVNARAQARGRLTVLGGPSVSAAPEFYPAPDILHLGELGDATDAVLAAIDEDPSRLGRQRVFRTEDRVPLDEFPTPAYERIDLRRYFLGSVQYSSGCPYRCEFCDIPALYGRNPRLKSGPQIVRELDALLAAGARGTVYFVDDNLVGNKKAAHDLLPVLVDWQERNRYPLRFACEATLNIAQMPELLALMRRARFDTVFVGIESPDAAALDFMQKKQNLRLPILDAVETLNAHGLEVVSGIIMGLDTDTPATGRNLLRFIEASNIPLLTINLLYALPKSPLYDRLAREGRLLAPAEAARRVSNIVFRMPYDEVVGMWFETITTAYAPEQLFARFRHQTERTYPNRLKVNPKPSWELIRFGLAAMQRVLWHCGVASSWRRQFWQLCWPLLRQGRIDEVIHIGAVAYHLLRFTDDIRSGRWEASFYAEASPAAQAPAAALSKVA
jgi:radical SAM superfamily enzyme YgiQ (UPF0313 family)